MGQQDESGVYERAVRARYAAMPESSRGRLFDEPESATRSPFQRDRDRIVHSTAFRRLTHKTQVFVYHEGDHYRSRLTHSLEVAQIARSIARTLGLDEDLAEAIALAHDLGHPPFGHAGEEALDTVMKPYGGFDHNAQSLAVVTTLERKYAAFDGLNLTWETLEGLVKHNGPLLDSKGKPIGAYLERGVPELIESYCRRHDLALTGYPSAEAQVAALADDIAYNNHDIDDGFRAGLCRLDDLRAIPLIAPLIEDIIGKNQKLEDSRLIYEVNRRLITVMVDDVVAEAGRRIAGLQVETADAIRVAGQPVIAFSESMNSACDELRFYLLSWVYRNDRILRIMGDAQAIITDLFAGYMAEPQALPDEWRGRAHAHDQNARARLVCNFIAGMTDRYAHQEHRRLFDATPELR